MQLAIKLVADRLIAAVLLIVCAPLMVIIGAAIRCADGGPALFRQQRVGKNGNSFTIFKLRTMIVGADRLLTANPEAAKQRVTRLGAVLRSTSLDELPQLWNILRGEMSFVGPRPVLSDMVSRLNDDQKQRFQMRPGITGLAQVSGRNNVKWSRRLQYDVDYVTRFSLALDLRILLKTLGVVVGQHGLVLDRNPEDVDDLPAGNPSTAYSPADRAA